MSVLDELLNMEAPMSGPPINQVSAPLPSIQARNGKHSGIAGVARDVLGTLGDILLTRLHVKPMYGPAQEQRKLAEAAQGYDQDPLGAIARVTDVDYGEGQKMRQNYMQEQRLRDVQDFNQMYKTDTANRNRDKYYDSVFNRAAGMLKFNDKDVDEKGVPKSYSLVRDHYNRYLKGKGIPEEYFLPEEYNSVDIEALRNGAVPVAKQVDQQETSDYHDATTANRNRRTDEYIRSNLAKEGISRQNAGTSEGRLQEAIRHNTVTEGETNRHHTVTENSPRSGSRPKPSGSYTETKTYQGKTYGLLPGKPRNRQDSWVPIN